MFVFGPHNTVPSNASDDELSPRRDIQSSVHAKIMLALVTAVPAKIRGPGTYWTVYTHINNNGF